MGIRDWFKKGGPPTPPSEPSSEAGVDGFPLASPPDRDTHERIDRLIAETKQGDPVDVAVERFLPFFLDRVELHRAAHARLSWYASRAMSSGVCVDLARTLYVRTFDAASRYLEDGDLATTLSITAAPLGWSAAEAGAIVSAVEDRGRARSNSAEVTRELDHLRQRFPPGEAADPAWAAVSATIAEQIAAGYRNREAIFAYALELHELDEDEVHEKLAAEIEAAYVQKLDDMARWPSVTDCERLAQAFARIEAQGVLALENGGFTQQEAQARAIDMDLARASIGRASRGFCYFHEQDVAGAIAGQGLCIGYGALVEPEAEVAKQIASIVVDACREAGLEAAWSGDLRARIHLPKLRWQRRVVPATEDAVADFLASWKLALRATLTDPDQLAERAHDAFEEHSGLDPSVLVTLHQETRAFLDEERRREASWTEATVNDRIDAALTALRGRGIVAPSHATTIQDGWGYVGVQASAESRGAAFFHDEDRRDGVEGRGIRLAFGALGGTDDDAAIGREVHATLIAHGVDASWSGDPAERITVAPFEWRMRRFTKAPSFTPVERTLALAPARSIDHARRRAFVERGLGRVLLARRIAVGLDLRLSRAMRAAWDSLGPEEPGHVCHVGLPVVFVPAGGYFTVGAMSARENLGGEERKELYERGARARRS